MEYPADYESRIPSDAYEPERAVPYDRRMLTDDQRSIADDIASAMSVGHISSCGVWQDDGDGCTCELLLGVADGLALAGVVAIEVERGWDPATRRGERVHRFPFRPMPFQPAADPEAVALLRALVDEIDKKGRYLEGDAHELFPQVKGRIQRAGVWMADLDRELAAARAYLRRLAAQEEGER